MSLCPHDRRMLASSDAADGTRRWQLRMKGPFSATPLAAGGLLYCVNEKGLLRVVDPAKPEGEVVGEYDLGQTVIGTPSIAAGSLFVRSDRKLWRIGPRCSSQISTSHPNSCGATVDSGQTGNEEPA
jgi:hypothetical protein